MPLTMPIIFVLCLLASPIFSAERTGVVPLSDEVAAVVCKQHPNIPNCPPETTPSQRPSSEMLFGFVNPPKPDPATCVGDDKSVCICSGECNGGATCECLVANPFEDLPPPPASSETQRFDAFVRNIPDPLISSAKVNRQDLTSISKFLFSHPSEDDGGTTVSEVFKYCEGCSCHYGICSVETNTCEYIGSAIEESAC